MENYISLRTKYMLWKTYIIIQADNFNNIKGMRAREIVSEKQVNILRTFYINMPINFRLKISKGKIN